MENTTNKVYLQGKIIEEGKLNHIVHDEKFYEYKLEVPRKSQSADIIPLIVSEKLLTKEFKVGEEIAVEAQLRSFNKSTGIENKSKLILYAFVKNFVEINAELNPNTIEIIGYVCKQPVYRITPFNREITDILIAVNRQYNKSDYIPCITWGRNAKYAERFNVGDNVKITGRIQSREYRKKISEDEFETKVAYEVSIINITKIES